MARDKAGPKENDSPAEVPNADNAVQKGGNPTAGDNKITLTVVVNGQAVPVEANVNAPLHTVVNKALEISGNIGQPPENWELKDEQGNVFDLTKKVEEFPFTTEVKLFLSLKAGAAGV